MHVCILSLSYVPLPGCFGGVMLCLQNLGCNFSPDFSLSQPKPQNWSLKKHRLNTGWILSQWMQSLWDLLLSTEVVNI